MTCSLTIIRLSTLVIGLSAVLAQTAGGESPNEASARTPAVKPEAASPGVCPPFFLRDETGKIINPVTGENAGEPYSPKQTCGAAGCHDYALITQGFHFQQGAGEKPTAEQAARCQWASTPGLYGGTWCSPAPLYRSLAPKRNASARTIDMTSFGLITAGCAKCHPGGGPLEYDRDGHRYDERMRDPAAGLTPDGDNQFDGDYYRARWSETGVLEADCLLCHLPGYSFAARGQQLDALNFRWAPTAGAGLAQVTGAVAKNEAVAVAYDASKFNPDGTFSPNMVVSPRNETCLSCHAQPGWKKRGANFRARTDVHLRAGLRCVDCHPGGSRAIDPRVRGREIHQFGKGDDPGGQVRNDLDNTVRDCEDCHASGHLGAPIAEHRGLPPLHLERIACQTCHIPERVVMPIQVQASDVFNPAPRVAVGGKQLWTFYGVDGNYRNHYGYLEMMGYEDKPTEPFRPALALYQNKIYPVNRVHSAWPGIEESNRPGLAQPLMSDVRKMWTTHLADPAKYPRLAAITDDNDDGIPEVNRPEEIDALIASVTELLRETNWPLEGKRVVWVMNDRVYRSGREYRQIAKHEWEASPYGNMHKYSHDVYPADAALGVHGCTDCHRADSPFFDQPVLAQPFQAADGRPLWVPNHAILGISPTWVRLGAWREETLKPLTYLLLGVLVVVWLANVLRDAAVRSGMMTSAPARRAAWAAVALVALGVVVALRTPDLLTYMLVPRSTLDALHFWVAVGILAFAVGAAVHASRARSAAWRRLGRPLGVVLVWTGFCGCCMLLQLKALPTLTRLACTGFDAGLALTLLVTIVLQTERLVSSPSRPSPTAEPQPSA